MLQKCCLVPQRSSDLPEQCAVWAHCFKNTTMLRHNALFFLISNRQTRHYWCGNHGKYAFNNKWFTFLLQSMSIRLQIINLEARNMPSYRLVIENIFFSSHNKYLVVYRSFWKTKHTTEHTIQIQNGKIQKTILIADF